MRSRDDDEFFDEDGQPRQRFLVSKDSDEFLAVGPVNDWAVWYLPNGPDIRIRLDFTNERVVVGAVAVVARPTWSIRPADLRDVPIGRLEAILNDPALARALALAQRSGRIPIDLSPTGSSEPEDAFYLEAVPASPVSFELRGLRDTPRPREFYQDLAAAWSAALAAGNKDPAAIIATANGVAVSTVHRWVRVARRLHAMAPSSRAVNQEARRHGP